MPRPDRFPHPSRVLPLALGAALVLGVLMPAGAGATEGRPYAFPHPAVKQALREQAAGPRASAAGPLIPRLPLGSGSSARASAARRGADLRAVSALTAPSRVLISVRSHSDVPAVARTAARLGGGVRVIDSVGVVSVTAREPARLVRELDGDERIASIEPDRTRRLLAEPADQVDPESGIPFGWAFDAVNAGPAIAAVGGGSRRVVAVIDSGVDVTSPDIAEQVVATYNSTDGSRNARDVVGHGTFVTGLIAMDGDNGIGGRGVGGATRIFGVRADNGRGEFSTEALVRAKDVAVRRGSDILNMSLGGETISESEARALEFAFLNDVLPVAAAGNEGQDGNAVQFPAAAVGGEDGEVGIGLSVAATRPDGQHASFSTHNRFVSVAAPGSAQEGCAKGVFSTIPQSPSLIFDEPESCSDVFNPPGSESGRYAYSEGTSFAAPIVSGIAALAWQANPELASEQVADVLQRSARQTFRGPGWNQFTGHGIVDGAAAVQVARRYDTSAPSFKASARRLGRGRARIRISGGRDRAPAGSRRAGRLTYGLAVSRRGDVEIVVAPRRRSLSKTVTVRRRTTYIAVVCDANENCGVKRLTVRP